LKLKLNLGYESDDIADVVASVDDNKTSTAISNKDKYLLTQPRGGEAVPYLAGIRASAVLDLLTEEEVGPDYLPSISYPSDHIAIAADLQLLMTRGGQ
jgi:saccharopine dehydrogenase-like NADP-dependent oxidoreductase